MSFRMTAQQHDELERYFENILEAHKLGQIDTREAVGELAHVLTAAAIDNEGEVAAHISMTIDQLFFK